jgi:hypothetical protein
MPFTQFLYIELYFEELVKQLILTTLRSFSADMGQDGIQHCSSAAVVLSLTGFESETSVRKW